MLPVFFEEIAFRNVRPGPRRQRPQLIHTTMTLRTRFSRRVDVRLVAAYSRISAFGVCDNRQRNRI